jgi:hypothetical protein
MTPAPSGGAAQLLPTIHVPRDIRLLLHHLPKPSYGSAQPPSQEPSSYLPSSRSSAAAAAAAAPGAAAMAAAMQAAADRAAARGGLVRGGSGVAMGSPYLQAPVAGRRQVGHPEENRISPRGPSSRLAVAGAAGSAAGAGVRPPSGGSHNNIHPVGAAAAAAAGRGLSPYGNGVGPSVLSRLQAAKAVAAAGVPSSSSRGVAGVPSSSSSRGVAGVPSSSRAGVAAGGVPSSSRGGVGPRTPPGGSVSPSAQMAAVMAQKHALGGWPAALVNSRVATVCMQEGAVEL